MLMLKARSVSTMASRSAYRPTTRSRQLACTATPSERLLTPVRRKSGSCIVASARRWSKARASSYRTLSSAIPLDENEQASHGTRLMNPIPDFNDAKAAYARKSTRELMRAAVSFYMCRFPFLVRHSEQMLVLSRKILGDRFTDFFLKQTLFGHFCAGEDETEIQPAIKSLEAAGIGSILDFAAEADGRSKVKKMPKKKSSSQFAAVDDIQEQITNDWQPKARVYDYESEAKCDRHLEVFRRCIRDVATLQKDGFAAVKITALCNPKILERMSRAIVEAQRLFAKFDKDADGWVTRDDFEHGFHVFFKDDDVKLKEMLEKIYSRDSHNMIDYISWSMSLTPKDLPNITANCREVGPLALATPTDEEVELIERMYERGHALAQEAAECGTRLLIDAEQVRFQPAIDTFVLDLQRTYNATTDFPLIYNTYQFYLKDTPDRLRTDVERSERFGYHFGCKLVRGAYMESEREIAQTLGYPSPIHETFQDTSDCYNDSVAFLLEHATKSDKQLELMLATHNQESLEKAIDKMNELGIDRTRKTVSFGQLFGMKDNLTYNLGKHGYRAYKYVPYGKVKMVMPYLVRRANENSSIAAGASDELSLIVKELSRRLSRKPMAFEYFR